MTSTFLPKGALAEKDGALSLWLPESRPQRSWASVRVQLPRNIATGVFASPHQMERVLEAQAEPQI